MNGVHPWLWSIPRVSLLTVIPHPGDFSDFSRFMLLGRPSLRRAIEGNAFSHSPVRHSFQPYFRPSTERIHDGLTSWLYFLKFKFWTNHRVIRGWLLLEALQLPRKLFSSQGDFLKKRTPYIQTVTLHYPFNYILLQPSLSSNLCSKSSHFFLKIKTLFQWCFCPDSSIHSPFSLTR